MVALVLVGCGRPSGERDVALSLARLLKHQVAEARDLQELEQRTANSLVLALDAGETPSNMPGMPPAHDFPLIRDQFVKAIETIKSIRTKRAALAQTIRQESFLPQMVNLVQEDAVSSLLEDVARADSWVQLASNALAKHEIALGILKRATERAAGDPKSPEVINATFKSKAYVAEVMELREFVKLFLSKSRLDPMAVQINTLETEYEITEEEVGVR